MERTTVEAVAKHPLFRKLSQADKATLIRIMQEEPIAANTLIFQEDSQGDSMYILVTGTVILQRDIDGEPTPCFQLRAGESFGELALLNPGPRLLTAKALETGLIIKLSNKKLAELEITNAAAVHALRAKIIEHTLIKIRHLKPMWEQLLTQGLRQLNGEILNRQ